MRRWVERLRRLEQQLPPPLVRVVFVERTPDGQLVQWPTGEPYSSTGETVSLQLEWDDEALVRLREGKGSDTAPAG